MRVLPVRSERTRRRGEEQTDTRLLLSVEDAAARLSIGRTTMFALIRERRIRTVNVGRRTLVPVGALEDFVAALQT